MTLSPPLYGADLPASFFDAKLPYGWNLRDLGDLLKTKGLPGVLGEYGRWPREGPREGPRDGGEGRWPREGRLRTELLLVIGSKLRQSAFWPP